MWRLILCLMLSCTLLSPAIAGPLEEGIAAYHGADYTNALRLLRPLANQGNAFAQSQLGVMYAEGRGLPQDYEEAIKWYRKAAEQGNTFAQSQLGVMYAEGLGLPQDYSEAIKWYRKAADQGDASAQFNLGLVYEHGKGVPQDYVQAHKWANLAASRSLASQTELRANAVKLRDFIAEKMTAAQIAEAQRLASEWKPK
jgi:TPR repeat protein